jgi:hypothetical protein
MLRGGRNGAAPPLSFLYLEHFPQGQERGIENAERLFLTGQR